MLRERIVTALILFTIVLVAIFYLPLYGFALVFGMFAVGSFWEWSRLCAVESMVVRIVYMILTSLAGLFVYLDISSGAGSIINVLLATAVIWWVYMAAVELAVNKDKDKGILKSVYMKLLAGVFIILPGWAAAVYLQSTATGIQYVVLFLLLLVGFSDTAAYFSGRAFGRHKLAPRISPGKTIEGFAGALLAVLILAIVYGAFVWVWEVQQIIILVVISLVSACFGVVGDLAESRFKRIAGVKDSGSLLPGHGGFLDRTDAFYAAAPVFAFALQFMEN